MPADFKPMLAAPTDGIQDIQFPCLASCKLDGIRCLIRGGKPVSRKLLDIPNLHIQGALSSPKLEGLDGELIVGPLTAPDCYNTTQSAVMSRDGTPTFTYYVFDRWDLGHLPFIARYAKLCEMSLPLYVKVLDQKLVSGLDELETYYSNLVEDGHEGVITKAPEGLWKNGRSTLKQNWMCKLKPREHSEAIILGFDELEHNQNEAGVDELGHTKRSHAQAGKVGGNTLGRVRVRDLTTHVEFWLGSGSLLTKAMRKQIWDNKSGYLGKIVRYSFCPVGVKDRPRLGVIDGFRTEEDL